MPERAGNVVELRTGISVGDAYVNNSFAGRSDNIILGGGGGSGMDPWQMTVETRLSGLDGRLGKIDERLGKVETSLATLTERVAHLPTRTALFGTAMAIVAALTAAISYGEKLQNLVG